MNRYLYKIVGSKDSMRKAFGTPYQAHRTIESAFGVRGRQQGHNPCFNVEDNDDHLTVLATSDVLFRDFGDAQIGTAYRVEGPKSLHDIRLYKGQSFNLHTRVNGVVSQGGGRKVSCGFLARSKGLAKDQYLQEWAADLLTRSGFEIPQDVALNSAIRVLDRGNESFSKGFNRITVSPLDIEAHVVVSDPVKAYESILYGVGKSRCFGYGMLVVRPV